MFSPFLPKVRDVLGRKLPRKPAYTKIVIETAGCLPLFSGRDEKYPSHKKTYMARCSSLGDEDAEIPVAFFGTMLTRPEGVVDKEGLSANRALKHVVSLPS